MDWLHRFWNGYGNKPLFIAAGDELELEDASLTAVLGSATQLWELSLCMAAALPLSAFAGKTAGTLTVHHAEDHIVVRRG